MKFRLFWKQFWCTHLYKKGRVIRIQTEWICTKCDHEYLQQTNIVKQDSPPINRI